MLRFLYIMLLGFFCVSCTKNNKIATTEKSFIWPLQTGNAWFYKGFTSFSDGATRDTTMMALEIDSMVHFKGNEYFSAKGNYDSWYRSAKGQVFEANATGDKIALLARNVSEQVEFYRESGTYSYFEGANTFSGTLTRTAFPEITVINNYNCAKTEDVYKDESGNIVQKKVVYYSIDKGPVCFKYYGNRETPGDPDIYLTLQYIIDSLVIQD